MDRTLSGEQLFDLYVAAGVTPEEIAKLDGLTIRRQIQELDPELDLCDAHYITHQILIYAQECEH